MQQCILQILELLMEAKFHKNNNGFIEKTYGKSKCLIKLYGAYIILLHYVKHKKPKQQKNSVCKYTKLGRK